VRWITQNEENNLITQLPSHLADMTRFTLATGLRESNVLELEWSQIDLQRRVAWIHPDQAKAGKAIGVPLNDDAIAVIKSQIGKHSARIFTYKGVPIKKSRHCDMEKSFS